ncbi:MAG: rod shape-determining protein RodA [Candidatus Berkelbacteria bacterium]
MSKKIETFDWLLLFVPILLIVSSVVLIYGLLAIRDDSSLALRQAVFAIVGLCFMVVAYFVDYRFFKTTAWVFYAISIVLLVLIEFFGVVINGSRNWFDLKFFNLQPSEISKLFVLFALAGYFSDKIAKITWKNIFVSVLIILPPLALIIREPDMGTAMVLLVMYFAVLFVSRPNRGQKLVIFLAILGTLAVGTLAYQKVGPFKLLLYDYQRSRITVFLNPSSDPLGRGYNVKQSQITIGSGSIFGKGLGRGTQSQLRFLPEPQTDFIFAGAAESFGFVGIFFLIGLYGLMFFRILTVGEGSRDNFGMLICFGIGIGLFFQTVVNIGMNIGLLPVTGIPLPLFSYGGTSMAVTLFALGIIQSVFIRHKKISF